MTRPTSASAPASAPPREVAPGAAPGIAPSASLRIVLDIARDEDGPDPWAPAFRQALPGATVTTWPETDPAATVAVVWRPSQAFFDAHPKVEAVFNLGAGVDALVSLRLPATASLYRLEDAGMGAQMVEYVCHALLRHVREFDRYDDDARALRWAQRTPRRPEAFPVGIMGLGVLGSQIARAVRLFGFPVHGWSRSKAELDGVTCHVGPAGLDSFLAATRVLVCCLPLTPATTDLLDRQRLSRLQRPGYLINIARGALVVDEDLVALVDEGHLAGACLDVFRTEPLPADHLLRSRPEITITPHISGQTLHDETLAQVIGKLKTLAGGGSVSGRVERGRGY